MRQRATFALALAAAAVPGLWVLGPVALQFSARDGGGAGKVARALSWVACAELAAAAVAVAIAALS